MNNAIAHFHITKKEQNMILRHMWPLTPIPPRWKEGFVLLYTDKFCSTAEVAAQMKEQIFMVLWPRQFG